MLSINSNIVITPNNLVAFSEEVVRILCSNIVEQHLTMTFI